MCAMSNSHHRLLGPAFFFKHDHPPVRNVNLVHREQLSPGQRVADAVATIVGSWPFIIVQSVLLMCWMAANVYMAIRWRDTAFDPYPFILLNLVLSFQAAYTGPVVMMSQNRQTQKDRLIAEHDFEINRKAEEEIEVIMNHLAYQNSILITMLERLGITHEEAESALRKHGIIDPVPQAQV
jgi:uncharacterized membrane protein